MKTYFNKVTRLFRQPTVAKLLGWLMALGAILLGLSMLLAPGAFSRLPSFQLLTAPGSLFSFLTPTVYGAGYLILGTIIGVFTTVDRHKAAGWLLALSAVHLVMCGLSITAVAGGYTATHTVLFFVVGITCVIAQIACSEDLP